MSHSYTTRSVTRRKDQLSTMIGKLDTYHLMKKEDTIDIVNTAMMCPDAAAHYPQFRYGVKMIVYAVSLNPSYANDQHMIALREEFEMFMNGVEERSDYIM